MVKLLAHSAIVLLLSLMPFTESHQSSLYPILRLELPEVTITAKSVKKSIRRSEYLGFKLEQPLDTRVDPELQEALSNYTGPQIKVTSLRRHLNNKSKHNIGKAVDFQFSDELIRWLISEEGTIWRDRFGMTFYIEDKPGSRVLLPYKRDETTRQYVKENPYATGDHIHINI